MNMHTSVSRGIGIALAIAVLLLVAFACAAAPTKSIPVDEANPRLQTVLQELARTAQARPASLPESARNRGIPLQADKVTVIVEPASGRVSSISQAAIAAIGGKVEAASNSLLRVQVPITRLEAMADQVNGIAFIRLPYATWTGLSLACRGQALDSVGLDFGLSTLNIGRSKKQDLPLKVTRMSLECGTWNKAGCRN